MNSQEFDVIVVGAGVMGSATAYFLSQKLGNKALLLEQYDFLHRRGSSHGDSRIIRYMYAQECYTELMFDAYKLWAQAEREASTKVFTRTGGVDFGHKDNPSLQSVIKSAQKFNVAHEVIDNASTISKRFPMIKLQPDYVLVYSPDSGILNATKSVSMFQQLARKNGCQLVDNAPVTNITTQANGKILVETGNGQKFITKKSIITTGAWTKKVAKSFANLELPLNPIQTTIAYWKVDQPEEYCSSKFPVFITYDNPLLYGTPCHEFPNLIKCAAHYGPDCDPDNRNFNPGNTEIVNDVSPWLQTVFTGVDPKPQMTESCMYTESPDGNFIIDTIPNCENIIIGCGFSGHGFKLAPVVGKLLATLSTTGEWLYPNAKEVFSLNRFKSQ